MRKIFLSVFMCLICSLGFAQEKYFFGKLMDSVTQLPVQDVEVVNSHTSVSDYTNSKGLFVIKGSEGDILSFARVGYFDKKIQLSGKLTGADTLHLYLKPKTTELQSVTVSAYDYRDYQADSLDRRKYFEEAIGYAHPLFDNSNSGAGIGLSLDRIFGKKQKNKKRAYKLLVQVEKDKYIDFRYNPILVHSYTGLRGDSLQHFINLYQPSYEWLRTHPRQEDVMYYINDKLKEYFHRKR